MRQVDGLTPAELLQAPLPEQLSRGTALTLNEPAGPFSRTAAPPFIPPPAG